MKTGHACWPREELFAEMMAEREDIAAKRAACQATLRALREAQATIETLPQAGTSPRVC